MGYFDPKVINEKVLDLMRQHGSNWSKPWVERTGGLIPVNAVSKRPYHGVNVFFLLSTPYESRYWATYKQWGLMGAQVQGGQKGTPLILFRTVEKQDKNEPEKKVTIPVIRTFTVFNVAQIEGWVPPAENPEKPYETKGSALVDDIFAKCEADIKYAGNDAYYSLLGDHIVCPTPEQFKDAVAFDGTRLHELGHWTGNARRLAREMGGGFGSPQYAREELVAELFSLYIGLFLGIEIEPRKDHAQYLASWMKAIREDKWVFYQQAKLAEKAMKWVLEKAGLQETETRPESEEHEQAVAA